MQEQPKKDRENKNYKIEHRRKDAGGGSDVGHSLPARRNDMLSLEGSQNEEFNRETQNELNSKTRHQTPGSSKCI